MQVETVSIQLSTGHAAHVAPVSVMSFGALSRAIKHLHQEFGPRIAELLAVDTDNEGIRIDARAIVDLVPSLVEWVASSCMDVVRRCTVIERGDQQEDLPFDQIAWWDALDLASAWVEVNFADPTKRAAIVNFATRTMKAITGGSLDLTSSSASSSDGSSPAASPSPISPDAAMAHVSPTGAGA